MPAKIFLDAINYPQVKSMVRGQALKITLGGTILATAREGVTFQIETLSVGKKGKMSTQDVVIANRLERIESKLPGQATRV